MQTKTCNKCGEEKDLSSFHPNKSCSFGVVGTCRVCTNKRVEVWGRKNRKRLNETANARNIRRKREAVNHFGDRCHDCGGSYQDFQYDFHHLDPTKKDVNPSKALANNNWAELEKCVMVCANCHRARHHFMRVANKVKEI